MQIAAVFVARPDLVGRRRGGQRILLRENESAARRQQGTDRGAELGEVFYIMHRQRAENDVERLREGGQRLHIGAQENRVRLLAAGDGQHPFRDVHPRDARRAAAEEFRAVFAAAAAEVEHAFAAEVGRERKERRLFKHFVGAVRILAQCDIGRKKRGIVVDVLCHK